MKEMIPVYSTKLVKQKNWNFNLNELETLHNEGGDFDKTIDKVIAIFAEKLEGEPQEQSWVILFNNRLDIIGVSLISQGNINSVPCPPREIFRTAMLANADSIMTLHNHPSNDLEPSNGDMASMLVLKAASNILGVQYLDSIIVGNDGKSGISILKSLKKFDKLFPNRKDAETRSLISKAADAFAKEWNVETNPVPDEYLQNN